MLGPYRVYCSGLGFGSLNNCKSSGPCSSRLHHENAVKLVQGGLCRGLYTEVLQYRGT